MSRTGEEENYVFTIPDNVTKKGRILGFRRKNWIEAAVAAILLGLLIGFVPFVLKVRIIVTAIVAGAVFVFFLVGIRRRTVSEWFLAWLKYKAQPKPMVLGDPRIRKSRAAQNAYTDDGEHLSYVEQAVVLIKQLANKDSEGGESSNGALDFIQKIVSAISGLVG